MTSSKRDGEPHSKRTYGEPDATGIAERRENVRDDGGELAAIMGVRDKPGRLSVLEAIADLSAQLQEAGGVPVRAEAIKLGEPSEEAPRWWDRG